MLPGDFNFTDFGGSYASPTNTLAAYPDSIGNLQPIQPSANLSVYPGQNPQHQHQSAYAAPGGLRPGEKRKASMVGVRPAQVNPEEQNRVAAEEDKRRRNTAASARFRKKKKQREEAMEKSAKEMTEKVTALEGRIAQLETENKWLKNLVMEKNDGKDDIANLIKEFSAKQAAQVAAAAAAAAAAEKVATLHDEAEFGDETG